MNAPEVISCSWLSEREMVGSGRITKIELTDLQGNRNDSLIFTTDSIMGEITTTITPAQYRIFTEMFNG